MKKWSEGGEIEKKRGRKEVLGELQQRDRRMDVHQKRHNGGGGRSDSLGLWEEVGEET